MTKMPIFFIVFINMRIKNLHVNIQPFPLAISLLFFLFAGCDRSSNEPLVMPPATNPLAREYIGFGVINVSFAHILSEPGSAGVSQGNLRRGTVVRIAERRQIVNLGRSETWVLAESDYREGPGAVSNGWLPEASLEIFDSERRANTASRNMSQ